VTDATKDRVKTLVARVKAPAIVLGAVASVLGIIGALIAMPDKIATASAKAVQTKLDDRYLQKVDYDKAHEKLERDTAAADEATRAAVSAYADGVKEATLGELRAFEGRMENRLDRILTHTSSVDKAMNGATPYDPLPRRK